MVPGRRGAYDLRGTMLRRLRIENLVLIKEAELAFAPGLNAITGETGAGKTILAQAIGLLLGSKGDAGYIGADGTELVALDANAGYWARPWALGPLSAPRNLGRRARQRLPRLWSSASTAT